MTESCTDNLTEPKPDQPVRDAALKQTQAGRNVLLHAMHRLEEALVTAAPGRERAWAKRVSEELLQVEQALNDHAMTEAQDELFATILDAKPNLFHRVERLRREHSDLMRRV
ncbi:MAG: hypothetical protein HY000_12120 [Planctomycetes bacterium]|nr:hypothetical protein [Planctomycetota bacterium]